MNGLGCLKTDANLPVKPVYVVYGEDLYLRREAIRATIRTVAPGEEAEVAVSRFEGASTALADVLDELRTLPFFSKRRVVLVEEADPFVTKHRKELETYFESPSSTGNLILSVKSWPSNTRLAKLATTVGLAIDCSTPREAELIPWLVAHATALESKLDMEAGRLLLELIGPELGILAAEVEKLAVYTANSGKIRREDVAKMVEAGRLENVWKVLDAATEGDAARATKLLDDLIAGGEHPVGLLAGMTTSLLRLHHAGRLRSARLGLAEACKAAGIMGSYDRVARQHGHLGPTRVDALPARLLRADLDVKGGSQLDPRVVLEVLVVELAGPRRD